MDFVPIAKTVFGLISGAGAATIVSNVAKHTAPFGIGTIQKIVLGSGSIALGGLVAKKTADYSEEMIDDLVTMIKTKSKEK